MTTDPALVDQLADVIAEAAHTHVGPRKMRPLWQAAHVLDWLTKQGSAALVTEQDDRLAVTWPTGRGLTTCTPEVIEGFVGQVNQLRDKLAQPCGSCHPCTNWADETWRRAGRKPPHIHEWDEATAELATLRSLLGLQPGEQVCGHRERFGGEDRVCLLPASHVDQGHWHRGVGGSWSL